MKLYEYDLDILAYLLLKISKHESLNMNYKKLSNILYIASVLRWDDVEEKLFSANAQVSDYGFEILGIKETFNIFMTVSDKDEMRLNDEVCQLPQEFVNFCANIMKSFGVMTEKELETMVTSSKSYRFFVESASNAYNSMVPMKDYFIENGQKLASMPVIPEMKISEIIYMDVDKGDLLGTELGISEGILYQRILAVQVTGTASE